MNINTTFNLNGDSPLKYHSITSGKSRKPSSELHRPLKRSTSINFRNFTPTLMNKSSSTNGSSSRVNFKTKANSLRRIKTNFVRSFSNSSNSTTSDLITPLTNAPNKMVEFTLDRTVPTNINTSYLSESDDDCFDLTNEDFTNDTSFNTCSNNTSPQSQRFQKFQFYNPQDDLLDDLAYICNTSTESLVVLDHLSLGEQTQRASPHPIFQMPEILELIIKYVNEDIESHIPQEQPMLKRSPSSLNHAIIQYGERKGTKIWESSQRPSSITTSMNTNLYNCLLVSKLWNYITIQVLNEHLYFKSSDQLENLTSTLLNSSMSRSIGGLERVAPKSLVLHKVKTHQSIIDLFASQISGYNLKWLEYYICPNILPTMSIITKSLQKLVLPGCKLLSDEDLNSILIKTPHLKHLDLRACELITDASIWFVGEYCPELELLNCGRHINGELITDASIGNIIKKCQLKTIGLAGCGISDWTIWELAIKNGQTLQRLSINYCWKLTDLGICKALKTGMFETLSVLEIKDLKIQSPLEIILWKMRVQTSGQKVVLEACERLDTIMKSIHDELKQNETRNDIRSWIDHNNIINATHTS